MASVYKGGLFTPGHVLSEMNTINRGFEALWRDITLGGYLDTRLGIEFMVARDEWRAYYQKYSGKGGLIDRATDWVARAKQYYLSEKKSPRVQERACPLAPKI